MRVIADEMDSFLITKHLEYLLTVAYAVTIRDSLLRSQKILRSNENFDDEEQIYLIIMDRLSSVNEDEVILKWRNFLATISVLKNISSLYLLKYQCQTYRDTCFKTEDWKQRLCTMIMKTLHD